MRQEKVSDTRVEILQVNDDEYAFCHDGTKYIACYGEWVVVTWELNERYWWCRISMRSATEQEIEDAQRRKEREKGPVRWWQWRRRRARRLPQARLLEGSR